MNLKFEIMLLVLGGVLRIIGVGVNVWYFITQKFTSTLTMQLCGAFLVAPSAIFLLLTVTLSTLDLCKFRFKKVPFKLGLGLLITFGGPLGIPLFVYAGLLACSESNTGDFYIIEAISRGTSLIEALFESLPQVVIQFYNNTQLQTWKALQITSITISVLGITYTGYKLCNALDKMQHYEQASAKVQPESVDSKTLSERKIASDLQVYDISEL